MAAEATAILKVQITPVLQDGTPVQDQLRTSAAKMIELADTLDRLVGITRTEGIGPSLCPWILSRRPHDPHRFQIDMDVSKVGAAVDSYDCPGL